MNGTEPRALKRNTYEFTDGGRSCRFFFENGGSFIVDTEDFLLVSDKYWMLGKRGYPVYRTSRKCKEGSKQICLHRLIMNFPKGDVDHINGEKTDNRRCNLRVCSHQQNMFNQRLRKNNSTGYIGVSYLKAAGKYEAYLHHNYRKINIGLFNTAEDAARARDQQAQIFYGKYARLNFA